MLDDIKKTLWATADKLRANMDAAEYKRLVLGLGLVSVKYISDTLQSRRAELTRRFNDESDEYFLHDSDDELLAEAYWYAGGWIWKSLHCVIRSR